MGLRFGVGIGPFYASAGLPKLGLGRAASRGLSAWISLSIAMMIWMLKLTVLLCWWTVKLLIIACIWADTTTATFMQSRRQSPPR
ncbi:hypothetical protein ACI798_01375 [Geodermatophilus sp. SYSU D01045]